VAEAVESPHLARFESFEANLRTGELSRNGNKIKLPEQAFLILAMLLEKAGDVVMRSEIQKKLWPNDTIVEFENSINSGIKKLRIALGDSADQPRYIETLARRGYRWKVPVQWVPASPAGPGAQTIELRPENAASYLIGKRVSHYRVLEILGGGGMGVVYRAEDIKLGRRVAVKFLPEELATNVGAMERFEREARAASSLNHPNVCTIYEVEEYQGQPFIVMELLEGQTLRELIPAAEGSVSSKEQKPPLTFETLLDVAIQITEGLEAAHKKGIIHRDIKPANIFVTAQGQVKILDFGLAKLQESETPELNSPTTREQEKRQWNPLLTLTRTGVAIGTAGYMSPEQIRGEQLDARTDLFSFGLVLYEMATGQRAFTAETAAMLHNTILNRVPASVRELNPELPPQLEKIINKALEKDRELRYRSAAEIRADLVKIKPTQKPKRSAMAVKIAVAATLTLLTAIAIYLWSINRRAPGANLPQLKQRQLTDNPSDNPILSGAISADGKYLAYADFKGMHVKVIETGESRMLPQPAELEGKPVKWGIVPTWLRDGTGFIANANTGNLWPDLASIWMFPALGGPPRKLRDQGEAYSLSRDGSWIVFDTKLNGGLSFREMWVMRSSGEQARKVYEGDDNTGFEGAEWSPDGQRLSFVLARYVGGGLMTRDLKGGPMHLILPSGVQDHVWSPDWRIIYSLDEPGLWANSCNYWAVTIEASSGKPIGVPKPLTNWAGFCMDSTSPTADGKRLVFRKWAWQGNVYVADFDAGRRSVTPPRRLSLNDGRTYPAAWTPDGKSVILESYADGHWRILKQSLSDGGVQPLVSGINGTDTANEYVVGGAAVSPDGRWLLYLALPRPKAHYSETEGSGDVIPMAREIKRVPIEGGSSELVMKAATLGRMHCTHAPASQCVIAERTSDLKQLVFTSIDVFKGRGSELARCDTDASRAIGYSWDVSPDGTRIAVINYSEAQIHVLDLNERRLEDIRVHGWDNLHSVNWTADGKGMLVQSATQGGSALLQVDLSGNAHVLWEQKGSFTWTLPYNEVFNDVSTPGAIPSPDGRRLAIFDWKLNANMWMMENF
jgi:eukaryotic-like serine/threonine-protein kinase